MRVVITGGGTGGHLYPALAVLEMLQADSNVTEILYIGNKKRKEAEVVPALGVNFKGVEFSGMPRKVGFGIIGWFFQLLSTLVTCYQILGEFKPDVVFATGGYVTAPVLMAAKSRGIPFIIHEPDAYPGLVNRTMSAWATAATCAFKGARKSLKVKELHVTGNPLRSTIGSIPKETALRNLGLFSFQLNKPILLVVGGSQGANRINQAVLAALPKLIDELGIQVIHQTGEKLFLDAQNRTPAAYRGHPSYVMWPFVQDMGSCLALADFAIARSGSMTLSEMYQAHVPTILVPYPYAAQDHQRANALASQEAGASLMVPDDQFTGDTLVRVVSEFLAKPALVSGMRESAKKLAKPEATAQVVRILKTHAKNSLS
jgi:UDP-N-acetylglucosamine--N-acetylmuramyl-(pentapeptide) pyrophosphoryl-undecaprenol N-acetylglucosamine transferase